MRSSLPLSGREAGAAVSGREQLFCSAPQRAWRTRAGSSREHKGRAREVVLGIDASLLQWPAECSLTPAFRSHCNRLIDIMHATSFSSSLSWVEPPFVASALSCERELSCTVLPLLLAVQLTSTDY